MSINDLRKGEVLLTKVSDGTKTQSVFLDELFAAFNPIERADRNNHPLYVIEWQLNSGGIQEYTIASISDTEYFATFSQVGVNTCSIIGIHVQATGSTRVVSTYNASGNTFNDRSSTLIASGETVRIVKH